MKKPTSTLSVLFTRKTSLFFNSFSNTQKQSHTFMDSGCSLEEWNALPRSIIPAQGVGEGYEGTNIYWQCRMKTDWYAGHLQIPFLVKDGRLIPVKNPYCSAGNNKINSDKDDSKNFQHSANSMTDLWIQLLTLHILLRINSDTKT